MVECRIDLIEASKIMMNSRNDLLCLNPFPFYAVFEGKLIKVDRIEKKGTVRQSPVRIMSLTSSQLSLRS